LVAGGCAHAVPAGFSGAFGGSGRAARSGPCCGRSGFVPGESGLGCVGAGGSGQVVRSPDLAGESGCAGRGCSGGFVAGGCGLAVPGDVASGRGVFVGGSGQVVRASGGFVSGRGGAAGACFGGAAGPVEAGGFGGESGPALVGGAVPSGLGWVGTPFGGVVRRSAGASVVFARGGSVLPGGVLGPPNHERWVGLPAGGPSGTGGCGAGGMKASKRERPSGSGACSGGLRVSAGPGFVLGAGESGFAAAGGRGGAWRLESAGDCGADG
jgi:hypothetical protein